MIKKEHPIHELQTKGAFIELDCPDVSELLTEPEDMVCVTDSLVEVIQKVREKNPRYTFCAQASDYGVHGVRQRLNDTTGPYEGWLPVRRFKVRYDDEVCGELYVPTPTSYIDWADRTAKRTISVKSRFTSSIRKNVKQTTRVDIAVKNVLKYIKPVALGEKFDTLHNNTTMAIRNAINNVDHLGLESLSTHRYKLARVFETLMDKHKDVMKSSLVQISNTEEGADKMLEDYDTYLQLKDMDTKIKNNQGMLVIKNGDTVHVATLLSSSDKKFKTKTFKHADLSDDTKRDIAMLSLCDRSTALTDTGIKVDEGGFYLLNDGDLYA